MSGTVSCLFGLLILTAVGCGGASDASDAEMPSAGPTVDAAPAPESTPPLPAPEPAFDCDRGRVSRGMLVDLPEHRLEQASDYSETESALLPFGRLEVHHSGCLQWIREFRFDVDVEFLEAGDAEVYGRAVELLKALAVAIDNRGARSMAEQVTEWSADGEFALGEDLTGEMFEGDYGLGVEMEAREAERAALIVVQVFKL